MIPEHKKEVDFYQYCTQCEYRGLSEDESPCVICLDHNFNIDSHKPIKFKQIDE